MMSAKIPDMGAPLPQEQTRLETRRLALIDCFAKATWIALAFAVGCLCVDGYAMFGLPHHPSHPTMAHGVTVFAFSLWTLEILLALLALWLVKFAFSQPPRLLRQP